MDNSHPELEDMSRLYQLGVTEKTEKELIAMKNLGFYVLNSEQRIKDDPKIFKADALKSAEPYQGTSKTQREFDNIDSEVEDPLNDKKMSLL